MGKVRALVIPFKTFKERISLIKKYQNSYFIENMGNYLYLVKK